MKSKILKISLLISIMVFISACDQITNEKIGMTRDMVEGVGVSLNASYIRATSLTVSVNSGAALEVVLSGAVGPVSYLWSVIGTGTILTPNAQAVVYMSSSSTGNTIIQVVISDSQNTITKSLSIAVVGEGIAPSPVMPIIYSNEYGNVYTISEDGSSKVQINPSIPVDTWYITWAADKSFYFFINKSNGNRLDACNMSYTVIQDANIISAGLDLFVNEILDVNGDKLLFRYGNAVYLATYGRASAYQVNLSSSLWTAVGITQNIVSAVLSPDNTKIAFTLRSNEIGHRPENAVGYVGDIYIADLDGSNPQKITSSGVYSVKDWYGDTLLATKYISYVSSKVITIKTNGSFEQDQSNAANTTYARCFSPEGDKILYLYATDVFIVSADGLKNKVNIATTDYMSFPDWK